jgi:hypothetical protein
VHGAAKLIRERPLGNKAVIGNLWMKNPVQKCSIERHIGSSGVNNELISLGQISVKAEVSGYLRMK